MKREEDETSWLEVSTNNIRVLGADKKKHKNFNMF